MLYISIQHFEPCNLKIVLKFIDENKDHRLRQRVKLWDVENKYC